MGQYYHPAFLARNKKTVLAWFYSHDYRNGLKLMEHSYMGNNFVAMVEAHLKQAPQRLVWAGDYAEKCKGRKSNVYDRCNDKNKGGHENHYTLAETRYIINHTKKQFVDKLICPFGKGEWSDYQVHPLPLLTCEGNGQGGGDYRREENPHIGIWARDLISVDKKIPDGYTELVPSFEMD